MTNYNEIAAEGLNNSNLYVDTLSHLNNKEQINSAYSGDTVSLSVEIGAVAVRQATQEPALVAS